MKPEAEPLNTWRLAEARPTATRVASAGCNLAAPARTAHRVAASGGKTTQGEPRTTAKRSAADLRCGSGAVRAAGAVTYSRVRWP